MSKFSHFMQYDISKNSVAMSHAPTMYRKSLLKKNNTQKYPLHYIYVHTKVVRMYLENQCVSEALWVAMLGIKL